MRVLVVEDEPLIARLLIEVLTAEGCRIVGPAESAAAAIALAETCHPDIALLNIDLKAGGSGLDVATAIYEHSAIPVIFVSGRGIDGADRRYGALGFICKPFRPSLIVDAAQYAYRVARGVDPGAVPDGLCLYAH